MTIDFLSLQQYAMKLAGAIIILAIGFPIANSISRMIHKAMDIRSIDPSLNTFLKQAVSMILKILIVLSAATTAGAHTTSFVAILGAAGFAVGLAFQGSLSNFAGGVLILVMRPFKVGDFINGAGEAGTVQEIGIVYTTITTPDNKVITIPNGALANSNITNFSAKDIRRVELVFGTAYSVPVPKVKKAIESVIAAHPLVLKDPEAFVRLSAHNSSSLDYTVRVWVKAPDYWTVHFDLLEQVKSKFDDENISIPYNILDINLLKQDA